MAQLLRALSCRDPKFRSQYLYGSSQLSVVHVLGCQMPTSDLCGNCTHMVHIILVGKISCIYIVINRSLMCMADKLITVFKTCYEGIR